ncbi:MAG: DegT/DnrJ/EryC1/StrS family aminotransferase [Cyclobacteriaceae bacterium]|nr:DegT/DnrJ/EryC1/StrS family aminotransferase [Cyclobacteriaceae bacterium]
MIIVNEPLFIGNEKKYLQECIETGWISSEGSFVKKFEEQFTSYLGVKHGIAVANGTVSLELALRALELEKGSEVIIPSHTIISCVMAVLNCDLVPVLVDVDPYNWTIDVNQVKDKISKKTKVIMPVHMFGHSCDMDPIMELAEKHGLYVLEDAAEVHGGKYKGKYCGSFGHLSSFSFYANKIITTGEGGMVTTDDEKLAEKCRYYRNLCFQPQQRFLHEDLGFNFRITNLQAAVGMAQVEVFDKLISIKKKQGAIYTEAFKENNAFQIQKVEPWAEHVYWVFGLLLKDDVEFDGKEWAKRLIELKVQTRPFFWGMHEQPALHKLGFFKNEHYPVTEKLSRRGLYVPSGMALTDEQMKQVIEAVKQTTN